MPIQEPHPEERRCQAMHLEGWRSEWKTLTENQLANPSFADLVVLARSLNPFPSRTRPLNSSAPMVLSLKAWKSRSLPGLPRTDFLKLHDDRFKKPVAGNRGGFSFGTGSALESLLRRIRACWIHIEINHVDAA